MKNTEKKVRVIKKTVIVLLTAVLCIALGTAAFYGAKGYMLYRQAAEERTLDERVRDAREDEDYAVYSELPEFYVNAAVSVEDHRFRKHGGIDVISIARAAWTDIKAWSFEEGGSTITQQLVKNLMFTKKKRWSAKRQRHLQRLRWSQNTRKMRFLSCMPTSLILAADIKGYVRHRQDISERSLLSLRIMNVPCWQGFQIFRRSIRRMSTKNWRRRECRMC